MIVVDSDFDFDCDLNRALATASKVSQKVQTTAISKAKVVGSIAVSKAKVVGNIAVGKANELMEAASEMQQDAADRGDPNICRAEPEALGRLAQDVNTLNGFFSTRVGQEKALDHLTILNEVSIMLQLPVDELSSYLLSRFAEFPSSAGVGAEAISTASLASHVMRFSMHLYFIFIFTLILYILNAPCLFQAICETAMACIALRDDVVKEDMRDLRLQLRPALLVSALSVARPLYNLCAVAIYIMYMSFCVHSIAIVDILFLPPPGGSTISGAI